MAIIMGPAEPPRAGEPHGPLPWQPQRDLVATVLAGLMVAASNVAWMAMNGLHNLLEVLETGKNEIHVDEQIRIGALRSTQRMLDFARDINITPAGQSDSLD